MKQLRTLASECNWPRLWIIAAAVAITALLTIATINQYINPQP